ncbi:hypothetical protein H4Q26_017739 [Puccinia striiformis f. sp. tritici PST-130]|nr:hypothetical protein H4Q26_017739 [Puccinia striiformis f. sp. tritici PST-130]
MPLNSASVLRAHQPLTIAFRQASLSGVSLPIHQKPEIWRRSRDSRNRVARSQSFEIVLDVKPDSYSLLNPPTPQSTLLYHSKYGAFYDPQRPQTDDYLLEFFLDGVEIGISEQLRSNPAKYPDERAENSADRICQDKRVIDSLGTIRVDVRICTLVRRPTSVTDDKSPLQTTNQMRFSERSKKALLGSTAGLAQDVPAQYPRPEMEWKATNIYRHPFLQVFYFRYKPRSILEAEGTIPQTIRQTEYPRPPSEIKNEGDDEHNVPTSDASRSRVKTEEEERTVHYARKLPRSDKQIRFEVYYQPPQTTSNSVFSNEQTSLSRVPPQTVKNPTTGAVQEIVTIESQGASPFEIALNISSYSYAALNPPIVDPESLPLVLHSKSANDHHPQAARINRSQSASVLDGILVGTGEQDIYGSETKYASKVASNDYSTFRSLQFAPVNLVDPDDEGRAGTSRDKICEDEEVIKSLGTIRIDVTRCILTDQGRREGGNAPPIETTNQMKFSERSKKAFVSTTAGLNEESISPYPRPEKLWGVEKQDPHPFLQFIFNYKPRSVLEDEGTVPKTTRPPEPPLPSRNVEPKVDVDEIIVVKKPKFEGKKSSGSRIKIDSDSEETEHQKVPKYESKPRRAKTENYRKAATDNKRSRSTSKVNKPGPKSDFLDLTGADDE